MQLLLNRQPFHATNAVESDDQTRRMTAGIAIFLRSIDSELRSWQDADGVEFAPSQRSQRESCFNQNESACSESSASDLDRLAMLRQQHPNFKTESSLAIT